MRKGFVFLSLLVFGEILYAADVTLTWSPIAETTELDAYVIGYGTSSGNYTNTVSCSTSDPLECQNDTEHTITGLTSGITYYFAVRADDTDGDGIDSAYGNEIHVTVVDAAERASAGFTVAPQTTVNTGEQLTFTSTATGSINGWFWYFDDGATAQGTSAQHSYATAGTYTVWHVVTGTRGSASTSINITVNNP